MRVTRLFVFLALAALLAPRAEASRTSAWGSNPPSPLTATRADVASALASLTPAAAADIEAAEPPLFDLGDVVLADAADADAEHFGLGPIDLLGDSPLRGPPPSYPETRVRGFELLPPFRVGASASLSLWGRQACGFSCREVVSDSREDPWGLELITGERELETLKILAGPDASKLHLRADGRLVVRDVTDEMLAANEGLRLISDLSRSRFVYEYREGQTIPTRVGDRPLKDSVENLDALPDPRYDVLGGKRVYDLPPEGVDSVVVIDPRTGHRELREPTKAEKRKDGDFKRPGEKEVSPSALAFHELTEAYYKVDRGTPYIHAGEKMPGTGAHKAAVDREKELLKQRPRLTEVPAGDVTTSVPPFNSGDFERWVREFNRSQRRGKK